MQPVTVRRLSLRLRRTKVRLFLSKYERKSQNKKEKVSFFFWIFMVISNYIGEENCLHQRAVFVSLQDGFSYHRKELCFTKTGYVRGEIQRKMRYVSMKKLQPGMVLGCDMYDFTTEALLKRGKVLTEHLIKRLADYGYQGVYIDDDISSGVEVKELVRVETRVHAIEAIRAMDVDAAKDVAEDIVEQILDADDVSVDMVDLRSYDDYTYFHSVSVAILAVIVGSALDYSKSRLWELCLSGMFHDIGKMFIDPNILNKPALLTSEEFGCMREHPRYSYKFLNQHADISEAVKLGTLCHHENEDGSGYPLGISGEQIPPFAKILHVVDVYDALASKRPYKQAYACSEAVEYLMGGSTTMFDEEIVSVFVKHVPIYPKGMSVILSDGREGIVSAYNEASNLRPKIRLMNGREIDLMNIDEYSALTILKPNNDDMALAEDIEEIEHKRKRRRETYQKNKKDAF